MLIAQPIQSNQVASLLLALLVVMAATALLTVSNDYGGKWATGRLGDFKYPVKLNFAFL